MITFCISQYTSLPGILRCGGHDGFRWANVTPAAPTPTLNCPWVASKREWRRRSNLNMWLPMFLVHYLSYSARMAFVVDAIMHSSDNDDTHLDCRQIWKALDMKTVQEERSVHRTPKHLRHSDCYTPSRQQRRMSTRYTPLSRSSIAAFMPSCQKPSKTACTPESASLIDLSS